MRQTNGELVGYISVDDPVDRLVPSRASIELLELLAGHALVAINNARLYRDLQERSRELEAATQRSNEINVLKSNFVSTVSHELLTPLTAIRAFLDALRAGGPAEAERMPRFLDVMNEETERLSRLIVSILDLSRFDSGHHMPMCQTVDLGELVGESAQVLQPMAEAGHVNLKVANELADTRLDADRDQLRQLLLHLGSNAIKFTPAGGSVVLRATGDERQVRLDIEDNGIGIPAESLDKVFDRFYQVDSSLVRRYGGVGLGLALCKSIVEWHGGRIHATSEPGRGSCFTVELPRRGTARVIARPEAGSAAGEDLVKLAIEMVAEVMNAGVVSMMTVQPGDELVIQAAIGLDPRVVRNARVRVGEGVSGWVARHRRPVCVTRPEDAADVQASGRDMYSTGTFLSVPLQSADGDLIGVLNVTDPTSGRQFEPEDCRLALDLAERVARAWERSRALESDRVGVADTAEALRQVIEHLRLGQRSAPDRVRLSAAISRELGLPESDVGVIAFAAAVHDVGMTLVGDNILGGRAFNDEERLAMQRHVELGADLLHRIETMSAVREVVLSHHEWWDGSGYPRGLRGTEIPIGSRVLAVVDAFESMTQGRAHRAARSFEAARDEIARLRGRQFDPTVVAAFERVLPGLEIRPKAEAHDGRSATSDAGR
jgi:signal transduction histidine kinase/response regulator RpfG family c-di-GMP phosphodiesterase